jgi:hypothetical protein
LAHFDFERGRVVNVATGFGASGVISIYEHAPAARQRDVVGSWRTKRVPYLHTFGLTPQHAILVAHPFDVAPVKMLWSSKGYIDHFDWHPQEGTRLVVIDRSNGAARSQAVAVEGRHAAGRRACDRREAERCRVRVSVDQLQACQRATLSFRVWGVGWVSSWHRVVVGNRQDRYRSGRVTVVQRWRTCIR